MFGIDQKLIVGVLVMAAWGGLVLSGMAPSAAYIDALKDILYGVCIYHVAQQGKGGQ